MFEGSVAVEGPSWCVLRRRDGLSVSPRSIEASATPDVLQLFFGVESIPRIGGGVSQSLAGPRQIFIITRMACRPAQLSLFPANGRFSMVWI